MQLRMIGLGRMGANLAIDGSDETAGAALDLMISIYSVEAGNLALKTLATGGVYLGGGIPPKILPKLLEGGFLQVFVAKGRFAAAGACARPGDPQRPNRLDRRGARRSLLNRWDD